MCFKYNQKTTGSKFLRSSQNCYNGRQSGDSFKVNFTEKITKTVYLTKNSSTQNATKIGSLSTVIFLFLTNLKKI